MAGATKARGRGKRRPYVLPRRGAMNRAPFRLSVLLRLSARKANPMADDPITFEASSGNVFADFGVPDADAHLARADRAFQIRLALRERKRTRPEAADQARTSQALQGQGGTDDV